MFLFKSFWLEHVRTQTNYPLVLETVRIIPLLQCWNLSMSGYRSRLYVHFTVDAFRRADLLEERKSWNNRGTTGQFMSISRATCSESTTFGDVLIILVGVPYLIVQCTFSTASIPSSGPLSAFPLLALYHASQALFTYHHPSSRFHLTWF